MPPYHTSHIDNNTTELTTVYGPMPESYLGGPSSDQHSQAVHCILTTPLTVVLLDVDSFLEICGCSSMTLALVVILALMLLLVMH